MMDDDGNGVKDTWHCLMIPHYSIRGRVLCLIAIWQYYTSLLEISDQSTCCRHQQQALGASFATGMCPWEPQHVCE